MLTIALRQTEKILSDVNKNSFSFPPSVKVKKSKCQWPKCLVAPSTIIVNTPVILFRTLTIFQQKVQVLLQFVYRKAMFLTSEQRGSKAAHMRGLRSIQSEKKVAWNHSQACFCFVKVLTSRPSFYTWTTNDEPKKKWKLTILKLL